VPELTAYRTIRVCAILQWRTETAPNLLAIQINSSARVQFLQVGEKGSLVVVLGLQCCGRRLGCLR